MQKYIFFSKSMWAEPPRIRHQLANLLREFGGSVVFFQNPTLPWQSKSTNDNRKIDESLTISRSRQLLHHQTRLAPLLHETNAIFETVSIKHRLSRENHENAIIINFNYDYFFLRRIFPKNKIVTIINDDFIAQAKFLSGRHVKNSLSKTCAISDLVLTVSYPLIEQLSEWCSPKLFLPWADSEYTPPEQTSGRNSVLIWASINEVIDYDLLEAIASARPSIKFSLVGPMSKSISKLITKICKNKPNITYSPPAKLEDVKIDDFLAGLMPYKNKIKSTEAVTLANKSFRLMSKGLPLIVHGMPHFYEHEAIHKCQTAQEIISALDYCHENFYKHQESIKLLIDCNQASSRHEYLQALIKSAEH